MLQLRCLTKLYGEHGCIFLLSNRLRHPHTLPCPEPDSLECHSVPNIDPRLRAVTTNGLTERAALERTPRVAAAESSSNASARTNAEPGPKLTPGRACATRDLVYSACGNTPEEGAAKNKTPKEARRTRRRSHRLKIVKVALCARPKRHSGYNIRMPQCVALCPVLRTGGKGSER